MEQCRSVGERVVEEGWREPLEHAIPHPRMYCEELVHVFELQDGVRLIGYGNFVTPSKVDDDFRGDFIVLVGEVAFVVNCSGAQLQHVLPGGPPGMVE